MDANDLALQYNCLILDKQKITPFTLTTKKLQLAVRFKIFRMTYTFGALT